MWIAPSSFLNTTMKWLEAWVTRALDVLRGMTLMIKHDWWEGIPWSWVIEPPRQTDRRPTYVIGDAKQVTAAWLCGPGALYRSDPEVLFWNAFQEWAAWTSSVARSRGHAHTPRDWLIFSTFPGRREPIPKAWVRAVETIHPAVTWDEWKSACALMASGQTALNRSGLANAVSMLRSGGPPIRPALTALPPPHPAGGSRGPGRPAAVDNWPADWEAAFTRVAATVSKGTASTYRSTLRRVVRAAGSHDMTKCAVAVHGLRSPAAQTVWNRFTKFLLAVDPPSKLPLSRIDPPIFDVWKRKGNNGPGALYEELKPTPDPRANAEAKQESARRTTAEFLANITSPAQPPKN